MTTLMTFSETLVFSNCVTYCMYVHKSVHSFLVNPGCTSIPAGRDTRRPNALRVPLCRRTHALQSVISRGTIIWNKLSRDIVMENHIHSFKKKLIKTLFENYYKVMR